MNLKIKHGREEIMAMREIPAAPVTRTRTGSLAILEEMERIEGTKRFETKKSERVSVGCEMRVDLGIYLCGDSVATLGLNETTPL